MISSRRFLIGGLALLAAVAAVPTDADADDRRTDRQVRLFERALDQMLVDSPNFLVQSSTPTFGSHDEGRGATFRFKTSLTGSRHHGGHDWWRFWDDGDNDVIVISRDDLEDMDDRDWKDLRDSGHGVSSRELERQAKKWERAKEEILHTIVDFGDVLTVLGDTDTITIDVRLRKAAYFRENDLRKLRVTVSMGDVRAYADGRIDESELERRIEMTES